MTTYSQNLKSVHDALYGIFFWKCIFKIKFIENFNFSDDWKMAITLNTFQTEDCHPYI